MIHNGIKIVIAFHYGSLDYVVCYVKGNHELDLGGVNWVP
jgi:hypothetical protein